MPCSIIHLLVLNYEVAVPSNTGVLGAHYFGFGYWVTISLFYFLSERSLVSSYTRVDRSGPKGAGENGV